VSVRGVKDQVRHRFPALTSALKAAQRRWEERKSPYAALDRAHEIPKILGTGTQIQVDKNGVWLKDDHGCYWRHVPGVYGPFLGLERGGGFESDEIAWAISILSPGSVFVDIGANIGVFCIQVAQASPQTTGVVVEPVRRTFESLEANIARNGLSARLEATQAAVGSDQGRVLVTSGLNAANHVIPRARATPSAGEELVERVTLDSLVAAKGLTRLDLVKLDVEGFELDVLRGANRTIEKLRPTFMMEVERRWANRYGYDPSEIFSFLLSREYEYGLIAGGFRPGSGDPSRDLEQTNNFVFRPASV
jgi:FkbM family methyltransferase